MNVILLALGTKDWQTVFDDARFVIEHEGSVTLLVVKREVFPTLGSDIKVIALVPYEAWLLMLGVTRFLLLRSQRIARRLAPQALQGWHPVEGQHTWCGEGRDHNLIRP